MNNALQKFLYLTESNFWSWQFTAFIIFSIVTTALYFLEQKSIFKTSRIIEYVVKFSEKSEIKNYFLLAFFGFTLCLSIFWRCGAPLPQTHDEFGYLLAADTFLNGRIVNPTPFSPKHFEYFHILIEPVYAAKYPPMQGVFLALGVLISGYPIFGVYLSGILSALAVYWLLRCFFSSAWSLFGGFLWLTAPLFFIWIDSYWGAHAAVIGGALSLGAFLRFIKSGNNKNLFIWGVGIFILLNSRLYEGAVLTLILTLLWLYEILKNKNTGAKPYSSLAVLVVILATNFLFIAFYNYSTTGNPLVLPYSLQHSQYHRTPLFVFQDVGEPKQNVPNVINKLDERWTAELQKDYGNWLLAVKSTFSRIAIYLFWLTRSPFLLALFLAGLAFSFYEVRNEKWKNLYLISGFFIFGLLLTTFTGDRFVAPVAGIFVIFAALGAKIVYENAKFLRILIIAMPLITGSGFLYGMISIESNRTSSPATNPENIGSRKEIENYLNSFAGGHLLFLETENANPADARFYVYNAAELGKSKIIWAHKLSIEENAELINFYKDRKIWLLKNLNHRAVLLRFDNQFEQSDSMK